MFENIWKYGCSSKRAAATAATAAATTTTTTKGVGGWEDVLDKLSRRRRNLFCRMGAKPANRDHEVGVAVLST